MSYIICIVFLQEENKINKKLKDLLCLICSSNCDMCRLKIIRLATEVVYIGLSFRWVVEKSQKIA
jgi:hypothetical protein